MAAEPKIIPVEPDSELGRALDAVSDQNVVLQRGGERFRVVREVQDTLPDYDPERAWAALERSFGILRGLDREQLKAELREQRGQDSAGRPGW